MQWPFDQAENCGVLTKRQIMCEGMPILFVSHDEDDHGWQFLDGAEEHAQYDVMLVCFSHVIQTDSSLYELADLPPGWIARRDATDKPWLRELSLDDDEFI